MAPSHASASITATSAEAVGTASIVSKDTSWAEFDPATASGDDHGENSAEDSDDDLTPLDYFPYKYPESAFESDWDGDKKSTSSRSHEHPAESSDDECALLDFPSCEYPGSASESSQDGDDRDSMSSLRVNTDGGPDELSLYDLPTLNSSRRNRPQSAYNSDEDEDEQSSFSWQSFSCLSLLIQFRFLLDQFCC